MFANITKKLSVASFKYKVPYTPSEELSFDVKFDNIKLRNEHLHNVSPPRVATPSDCRRMGLTYSIRVIADVTVGIMRGETLTASKKFHKKTIFSMPNMVQSCCCVLAPYVGNGEALEKLGESATDMGGYFIINGKEKVLVPQEVSAYNVLQTSVTPPHKRGLSHYGLLRTIQDEDDPFPKKIMFTINDNSRSQPLPYAINVNITGFKEGKTVPIGVVFKALGCVSDRDIVDMVTLADDNQAIIDCLRYSIVAAGFIQSQEEALIYLATFIKDSSMSNRTNDNINHSRRDLELRKVSAWLYRDFLPMIVESGFSGKVKSFGLYTCKFIKEVLGIVPAVNRESLTTKRFNTSGDLLTQVLRDSMNDYRAAMVTSIRHCRQAKGSATTDKELLDNIFTPSAVKNIFENSIITSVFDVSFTKDWAKKQARHAERENILNMRLAMVSAVDLSKKNEASNAKDDTGVSQDLNRMSHFGYLAHMRRTNYDLPASVKLKAPRALHNAQYGYFCFIDAPDGANLGVLKQLATGATFTRTLPKDIRTTMLKIVNKATFEPTFGSKGVGNCLVFIDGVWRGCTTRPDILVKRLRTLRSLSIIPAEIAIYWNILGGEIDIRLTSGRPTRLLINAKGTEDARPVSHDESNRILEWLTTEDITSAGFSSEIKELVNQHGIGLYDWVDVMESQNCLIGFDHSAEGQYTHFEPHPSLNLSPNCNMVPFTSHASVVRPGFACSQMKQALHIYTTNFDGRYDAHAYVMKGAARAMVTTDYEVLTGAHKYPNGRDVMVMIASNNGYSQEDGLTVNRASIERGLFALDVYHTITYEEETNENAGAKSYIVNPAYEARRHTVTNYTSTRDYSILEEHTGLPVKGMFVHEGIAILGMVTRNTVVGGNATTALQYSNTSKFVDSHTHGVIDQVITYNSSRKDDKVCKIRLREYRQIDVGDKLSFLGMKGVVCQIRNTEDMPVTEDGRVPDIIMGPQGFPTRLMVGLLLYGITALLGALKGRRHCATAFTTLDPLKLADHYPITEHVFYDPISGRKCPVKCIMALNYYYRIKQQTADKIFFADAAKVTTLTRQAGGGRSSGGGLSLGNMVNHICLESRLYEHF